MERILERLLHPSVVWVFVPILAIVIFGLSHLVRSARGVPEDAAKLREEITELRSRVDALERTRGG